MPQFLHSAQLRKWLSWDSLLAQRPVSSTPLSFLALTEELNPSEGRVHPEAAIKPWRKLASACLPNQVKEKPGLGHLALTTLLQYTGVCD